MCQASTWDALLLDMETKAYFTIVTPRGKGPWFADQACKQHEAEVRQGTVNKEGDVFLSGQTAHWCRLLTQTSFAEKEGN